MNQWTNEQVQDALQQLYKKAATDEKFRTLCLQDPEAAVREVSGEEIPQGFRLRFVENNGADMTLVLPDMKAEDILSEDELEQVAGGTNPDPVTVNAKIASCA